MGKAHVGIDLHLYSHIGVHFFPLYLTPCTKKVELYASVLQNSHTYVRYHEMCCSCTNLFRDESILKDKYVSPIKPT